MDYWYKHTGIFLSVITGVVCILNFTDIKDENFHREECGRNSLIIPNESCINCIYLEAPISYSGYQEVTIRNPYKQLQIVEYMKSQGVQKAVIGLKKIASSELWWVDAIRLNYNARVNGTSTTSRDCYYLDISYPTNSNWVDVSCKDMDIKYYLLEWTNVYKDKKLPQPIWYEKKKPYLFQCRNNESISFAFECDQKADCSDLSDEKDCEYSNAECLLSQSGIEFSGLHRTMDLDLVCMNWKSQHPHIHKYTHFGDNENFCRHSDRQSRPWCFTVNSNVRWGHCAIPTCNKYHDKCLHTENGIEYTGTLNRTKSGLLCQSWKSDIAHDNGYNALDDQDNYCRYTADKEKPWCFTNHQSVIWEYCDLPQCGTAQCPNGFLECLSGECVPAEKVCDGKVDCPNNEDEINCGQKLCPGMFRCRGGKCLSLLKVCDGYPDCYRGDDEILCHFKCPDGCECRGLTYKCRSFPPAGFSKFVRNLDISYLTVDLNSSELSSYLNLAFLNLSGCGIDSLLPENEIYYFEKLANLRTLDLSYNNLKVIHPNVFSGLKYLSNLLLADNRELTRIMAKAFNILENVYTLRIVRTKLKIIEPNAFYGMSSLAILDLSNNSLSFLNQNAFNGLSSVKCLDIRYNQIIVTRGMFSTLTYLIVLEADVYRLCCAITVTGKEITCTAEESKVSSCENLIKYEILRLLIWLIGGIALLGNLCVLCYRFLYDRSRILHSYSIFIIALSLSDMLMGVYMLIIAAVDAKYRNEYVWHDQEWRNSNYCALAGFLATVSSESSAILICLIAVDRCLAIKLTYSRFKVTMKYAIMLSIGSFLIAIILATMPLLPLSYFDGKFYSRSTVCIAMPLTNEHPQGWQYSVAVFVGFNMALFLTVGISQISLYRDVRQTMNSAKNKQISIEISVAKSLAAVVMTDFLCWFPVGAMGILGLLGVEIPSDIYAWVIVFILPVNSALNPFLYTFSRKFKNNTSARQQKIMSKSISLNEEGEHGGLTCEKDLISIALDFHNRFSKKSYSVGISLNNYLKMYPLNVENLYRICYYTIIELRYLHCNQMVHGNLSKEDIFLVEKGGTVTDVLFQFKRGKTSSNSYLDIQDYGQMVKHLIKHHLTKNTEVQIQHDDSSQIFSN